MLTSKVLEKKNTKKITQSNPPVRISTQTQQKIEQELYRKRRFEIYFRYKNRKSL